MQIVRDLGGYSLGRSDMVRRAMSKKKHSVMEQERKNFIYGIVDEDGNVEVPGCLRNGISEKAANEIFDQMMDFAMISAQNWPRSRKTVGCSAPGVRAPGSPWLPW